VARPAVDVVIPFGGDRAGWAETVHRMSRLRLGSGDTLTVVDNTGEVDDPRALVATAYASSYYARNRGAERGRAEWIVFLDSDVVPVPDLLDRHFDPPPDERTAIVAGGIVDQAPDGAGLALRYAGLKRSMSHETVLTGRWSFAQTANCAVRRSAFEEVGGFAPAVRSGGDADLAFRLAQHGWRLEVRGHAEVVHLNRPTVKALLRQRMRHGSGAAWLQERHPGSFPPRNKLGLLRWTFVTWARALGARARGDTDQALVCALDPVAVWAFELGRRVPNYASRRPA